MMLSILYKENRVFFLAFILFAIASAFILLFYTKAGGFYFLNFYHTYFLNIFFIFFTYVGDGFFCVAVGLALLFFRRKFLGCMVLSSYAISGIIAQVLKYFILEARPAIFLKDSSYQYFIENVTLHNLHAFPSGHTASAMALAAVLSFGAKNKDWSLLFLVLAILVGYSRIYLAQHFIDDVLAGAFIGLISGVACWIFFYKLFQRLTKTVSLQSPGNSFKT